ncbi:hypothetical protein J2W14_002350 [Pseudarthrobacter oxydans]|uniref:hypothetical protein n=1 Tax=Pseudarthrobacter oxydans TaxID=1671 RepID=UPI0027878C22|nr:hypothetical protein [Pseudarthrobacter oxydans]MDP9982948.1 hypothetical protein [Pseudarthrobacter oxydans]
MPYMPGGGKNQIQTLETLLSAVDANEGLVTATVDLGDGVQRVLRDALKQIAPAGLITSLDRDHQALSEEARRWLSSRDPRDLLAIFHRHVRFVGELLHALEDGAKTVRELTNVAATEYQLQWTTLDQVRRRVTWLSVIGLTEYKTNTLVGLTDAGREMVPGLQLGGPERMARTAPAVAVPEPPQPIAELIKDLMPEVLAGRNPALGYIPRGNGETDLVQSLYLLVNAASPRISRADLLTFAQVTFGVSESSFSAVMTTLNKSGLLEQTGFNIYSPSGPATAWLESQSTLDLVLILHRRCLFVLEIIPLLAEFDKAPDLARAAYEHYGMTRVDVGGIRTRMQLLKAAGLISERANWRYQPTPLGERIALEVPLQSALDEDDDSIGVDEQATDSRPSLAAKLTRELEEAAVAGDAPVRLEKAVADAFSYLGFAARHIGGGGKTDVLATVEDSEGRPVRVILDAKAARSGIVNEGAVSFDALSEHKEKHHADFVALVGPSFDGGRVRARAEQNGVALITVEELSRVLRRYETTPRSASTFLSLVDSRPGARKDLEGGWSLAERRIMLLSQVVAVLAQEAREADEVTHGALSAEQIYLIVRDEIDPRPSTKDIEEVLQLLEHPLIASVNRTTGGVGRSITYRLIDAPGLVAAKVEALGRSIARVDTEA